MYLTGDLSSSISDLGVGLSTLLIDSNYSRSFETEADYYALNKMLELKIESISLYKMLNKIIQEEEEDTFLDYFSSHPTTEQRNLTIRKYQSCFEQKIAICK